MAGCTLEVIESDINVHRQTSCPKGSSVHSLLETQHMMNQFGLPRKAVPQSLPYIASQCPRVVSRKTGNSHWAKVHLWRCTFFSEWVTTRKGHVAKQEHTSRRTTRQAMTYRTGSSASSNMCKPQDAMMLHEKYVRGALLAFSAGTNFG